jgi:hypothetical protein
MSSPRDRRGPVSPPHGRRDMRSRTTPSRSLARQRRVAARGSWRPHSHVESDTPSRREHMLVATLPHAVLLDRGNTPLVEATLPHAVLLDQGASRRGGLGGPTVRGAARRSPYERQGLSRPDAPSTKAARRGGPLHVASVTPHSADSVPPVPSTSPPRHHTASRRGSRLTRGAAVG